MDTSGLKLKRCLRRMGNKSSTPDERDPAAAGNFPSEESGGTPEEMSYFQMAKVGYEQLVNAIIRPPRCNYTLKHLGPPSFTFCGRQIKRRDFELHNLRGLLIMCSMWEPVVRKEAALPCIIYMHGNSSGRVEALPQLSLALALGCTFLAFDFAGSGLSEGEYVSLGHFEKDDLLVIIEYLRGTSTTSSIALWGRSMGAATALMHGERDPSIGGMILDSSFADLQLLAEGMVEKGKEHGYSVPNFVVRLAIRFIRSSVLKSAGFDIRALSPIKHVNSCYIPALFVAGSGDSFVPPSHSQMLHDRYAGEKTLEIVEGDHNTPRPPDFFSIAAIFLISALQIPEDWISQEGLAWAGSGMGPWAVSRRIDRNDSAIIVDRVEAKRGVGKSSETETRDGYDVALDEIIALSLMDEDLDIGMTPERQAEMQRSLMTMLGDRRQLDELQETRSKVSNPKPKASRSIKLSVDALPPPSTATSGFAAPPQPPTEGTVCVDGASTSGSNEESVNEKIAEWTCSLCTLLNSYNCDVCVVCETPKPKAES